MIHFSLASWYHSITLLSWSNLRLFTLVSLKTFFRAAPLLLSHFWGLILLHAIIQIFLPPTFPFLVVKTVVSWMMIYLYCLALRPSLEIKNKEYFYNYAPYLFYFLLIGGALLGIYLLCMGALFICNIASLAAFLSMNEFIKNLFVSPLSWEVTYPISAHILFPLRMFFSQLSVIIFSTWVLLSGLFELDNPKLSAIPTSIKAGIKMVGYNLPVMILLGGLFTLLTGSHFFFSQWYDTHSYLMSLNVWVLKEIALLFILSFMVNFYLKIKHSNYTLFFAA